MIGCLPANLADIVQAKVDEGKYPGLSISVLIGDTTQSAGFGTVCVGSGAAVTPTTVFEAASLTKPVFAAAALQLAEEAMLTLDEPLNRRLLATYLETDERIDAISMRHVLSHIAGFPNWRPAGKALTIGHAPGSQFSYSGEGYLFLQTVIEQMTGQAADRLVAERVFAPLRMQHSSLIWRADYEATAAPPHKSGLGRLEHRRYSSANAAYSLYTTSEDYARFLSALLAPDRAGLLSERFLSEMLTPQVRINPLFSWGLGWGLDHSGPDGVAFWHWGDNRGYKSIVAGVPARQMAVVVFSNGDDGLLDCFNICCLALQHPLRGAGQFLEGLYGGTHISR